MSTNKSQQKKSGHKLLLAASQALGNQIRRKGEIAPPELKAFVPEVLFTPTYSMLGGGGLGALDSKITPVSATEFFLGTLSFRWIHLPKAKAREPWTNLSRSVLNTLVLPNPTNRFRPPVVSASFVQPGQRKATRLINLQSLLSYVQGRAAATAGVVAAAAKRKRTKVRKAKSVTRAKKGKKS